MTTELTTLRPNDLQTITDSLTEIKSNLTTYTNESLADTFGATKPLEKALKDLNESARKELIERRDEFGGDSKGNRYISGERFAAKLTRRVSVKLEPDAEEKLADYLHLFDRKLDVKLAEQALAAAGIDRDSYTVPEVTKEQLEKLNEKGLIPDEVAVACLSDESISWAVAPVAPDKVV